jgi:alpha-tubulin suppressor-like RCC1 family protein
LSHGVVKCWGYVAFGFLGLGDTTSRGDLPNEMGDNLPAIDLGSGVSVRAITLGDDHTCALLNGGSVKCWGVGGELGAGDIVSRGSAPNQMGDNLPAVDLGTGKTATSVVAGYGGACAILNDGILKCWGLNYNGQLGLGDTVTRGDKPNQTGDALPAVDLGTGRTITQVAAGNGASAGGVVICAILNDSSVKCWGAGGSLGLGDLLARGEKPNEMGDNLPRVKLFSSTW